MKIYSTESLTLDQILQDLKRNVSQVENILTELKRRGAEQSGHAMIRDYPNVMEAVQKFIIVGEHLGKEEPFLYSNGRPVLAGTREEAELLLPSCGPSAKVKELGPELTVDVRGVYGLDDSAPRFITAGQDETGEPFYDVPIRLHTNPCDGLPETLWLRFRDSAEEAKLLADRPNVPIQITVQYNAQRRSTC